MDSLIRQTRRKHPAAREKTGEKKVAARKSVSFKEDKKKPSNWLQKQFSRQMSSQSYDPISDMDHAAAVAATAYAITTFQETWLQSYHSGLQHGASLPRSKSKREDVLPLEEPISLSRRFSELEMKDPTQKSPGRKSSSVKKTPTFSMSLRGDHTKQSEDSHERQRKPVSEPPARKSSSTPTFSMNLRGDDTKQSEDSHERQRKPVSEPPAPMRMQPPLRTRSERRAPPPPPSPLRLPAREVKRQSNRKDDSTADAWEKAELAKIKARYEKLNRKIDLWEAKKRDKARRKLDKSEQSEVEQRRKRGLQRFREDTEYIEHIAAGARAQAEKQRQSEEFKVKEKAGIIRSTGKLPGKACLCF